MPVLMLLIAGIVEFGTLFQVYASVNRLATQYAIAYADCSDNPNGTCNTELSFYTPMAAVQNIVPQLKNAVTLRMFEVTMQGTTPTVVYASPSNAALSATETATAKSALASGQVGVVVTVSYAQNVSIFPTLMAPFIGSSLQPSYTIAQLKS